MQLFLLLINYMDYPLSQDDVIDVINRLTDNLDFTIYLMDDSTKNKMCRMVKKKAEVDDEIIEPDYFLIFYDIGHRIGHWAALIINYEEKIASYFCSFGLFVDNQYQYGGGDDNQDLVKDLLHDLYDEDFLVYYNDVQLQNIKSSVCGRYVAAFLGWVAAGVEELTMNPKDFTDFIEEEAFENEMTPDEIIIQITS